MNAPKYPGMFAIDQRVVTTEDAGADDWRSGTRENCRWGVAGVIRDAETGHGWCYLIEHEDGSMQWYDHEELREPGSDPSGDDAREGVTTSVVPGVVADGEAQNQEMQMEPSNKYEIIEYAGETYRVSLTITGRVGLARQRWRWHASFDVNDAKLSLRGNNWNQTFVEGFVPYAQERYDLRDDDRMFVVDSPFGRLRFHFSKVNSAEQAEQCGMPQGEYVGVDYEIWEDVGAVGVLHHQIDDVSRIEDCLLVYHLRCKVLKAAIKLAADDRVFAEPQDSSFGGFR